MRLARITWIGLGIFAVGLVSEAAYQIGAGSSKGDVLWSLPLEQGLIAFVAIPVGGLLAVVSFVWGWLRPRPQR